MGLQHLWDRFQRMHTCSCHRHTQSDQSEENALALDDKSVLCSRVIGFTSHAVILQKGFDIKVGCIPAGFKRAAYFLVSDIHL